MARRRALLLPSDATNEGARRLRELLRRHSFGWIARKLRCDEKSVRTWAREEGKPNLQMRARIAQELGLPEVAWDESPDAYAGAEPATTKRGTGTG